MSIPPGFIRAEGCTSEFDAQVAAHDYAHEGYYFRIVRGSEAHWDVYVKYGRERLPACCKNKRTYVDEPTQVFWEPRSKPSVRKRTGHTRIAR